MNWTTVRGESPYHGRVTRALLAAALCLAALTAALLAPGAVARPRADQLPRVTLIGDSVADALEYSPDARRLLGVGVDLKLQIAPCRRVDQLSCPYQGVRPPNVIELVSTIGTDLGQTVIVAVGYNDYDTQYAGNIESALLQLRAAGVTRVIWPTLRAAYHSYLTMNDDIRAAAARHPEMTVVDWNVYSRSHPDWFQKDGLHLTDTGAIALSTLLHRALVNLGVAPLPVTIATSVLGELRRGRPYTGRLAVRGGRPPYRWTAPVAFPRGLHLLADGRVVATPLVRTGTYALQVKVADAVGQTASRRVTLRVRSY